MTPFGLALIACLVAAATAGALAAGLVVLGRAQRRHRRLLDARIDELARVQHEQALAADHRADALGRRVEALERLARVDSILGLIGVGERAGRLAPDAARRLERAALRLRAEASADERAA